MRLCAGADVTSDREIQKPAPSRPSQQRGAHLAATRAGGWSGDATARALAWLDIGRKNRADMTGRRRERGRGRRGCWRIARKTQSRRIAGRTEGRGIGEDGGSREWSSSSIE